MLCERWRLVGPPASALRGLASNRLDAALAEDRRGERSGKRPGLIRSGGDQEDVPEALGLWVERALLRRRKGLDGIKIGAPASSSETSLAGSRVPGHGARRGGGVILVCGYCTEREKASVESGRPGLRVSTTGGERERANGRNRRH